MAADTPAYLKAHATGRWAETIFLALSSRIANRWQFISFRGKAKGEWRGVVDVLAIRKDTSEPAGHILKRGDLFDIVVIQIKGGSARQPTHEDCIRLREVAKLYRAQSIVQFQWRKNISSIFYELDRRTLKWKPTTGAAIFS
jgi:hypothetical protein